MKYKGILTIFIGTLFCLVTWGVSAQLQRSANAQARQQWEYKSIGVNNSYWEEDGRQAPGNALQELRPKFSVLGVQGWELVAVSDEIVIQEGQRSLTVYWFKRPK